MSARLYDAGALLAAERGDRRVLALHQRALDRWGPALLPTVVLAQVWRGRPRRPLQQLLSGCELVGLDAATAREAGELCGLAGTSGIVDAAVVVVALRMDAAVLTTDRGELDRLASARGRRLALIDL